MQNVRYFDRRNLMLENADVDRVVTSEKTPLEVDFVVLWRIIDVKQYYVAVQGNEDAARAPPVADRAQQPRRGIQQVDDARGDLAPAASAS